ncbi:MAG: tetratricopeptide repeat protein [Acidobacteria bacterium]|nr:tetratricopeptide repeat protein [Acidobacteriota bacterium]
MTRKAFNLSMTAILACLLLTTSVQPALGQTDDSAAIAAKAQALFDAQKMTEALPLYEKLAELRPSDPSVHRNLGFALLGQAANTSNAVVRRQLRIRARAAFIRAAQVGEDSQLVKGMVQGLPPDGSEAGFSDNADANRLMRQGEAAFSSGKMDEAIKLYQDALKIDPRCYYAALFAGDVNMHKENYPEAEKWYQKAISIDPFQETAYRYSATPLMKQQKYPEARDRYVESFIVAPYSRLALSGIIQWAQATNTSLSHPKIDLPEITIGADGKAKSTLNVNPLVDDGSMAWIGYVATRETWRKEKFAKQFPQEPAYRHSLQEEVEALRSVVEMARSTKPKKLNGQIEMLAKLDAEGLLEAFVLMALPDEGIAQDHRAYLAANRDKMRRYVVGYVIKSK